MKTRVILLFAALLAGFMHGSQAEPRKSLRYIDALPVPLYAAPNKRSQVLRLLNAGYRVQLIKSDRTTGFSKVYYDRNKTGWVLTRQITRTAPAHHQLRMALLKINELNKTIETLKQQKPESTAGNHGKTDANGQELKTELTKLNESISTLSQQLDKIKQSQLTVDNIQDSQSKLVTQVQSTLQSTLETFNKKLQKTAVATNASGNPLKGDQRLSWILWGSLVIGIAFGLGIAVTRIRWRRDSIWS